MIFTLVCYLKIYFTFLHHWCLQEVPLWALNSPLHNYPSLHHYITITIYTITMNKLRIKINIYTMLYENGQDIKLNK